MKKKLTTCLAFLAILSAFNPLLGADTEQVFDPTAQIDGSDYTLSISQEIPLLKDTVFNGNKCWVTDCPLTLTNNSDSTLKYTSMSASWWDIYSLDNKNFSLAADYWNVFKNGEIVYVLPPHQSVTKSIKIITYKDYFRGEKLRIAMHLRKTVYIQGIGELASISSDANYLLWSNEVIIN